MKLLRANDHRRMPWRNGGGETLEVAVSPAGAGIDAFDWRVSMAVVATDGAFSAFPGTDRTLTLLDGEGMMLDISGMGAVRLAPNSAPCAFPGDVATSAALLGGPITDLNVMTARDRYTHAVERRAVPGEICVGSAATLLLLGDGVTVYVAAESVTLGPRDMVLLEPGETTRVCLAAGESYLLVTIRPIG